MENSVLGKALASYIDTTQRIRILVDSVYSLEGLALHSELTKDQQRQLQVSKDRLDFEKQQLAVLMKVISENAVPESTNVKTFTKADQEFIVKVTGIKVDNRRWNIEAEVAPEIAPDEAFEKIFRQNSASFHFRTEAGRRTVLDLFLRDVVSHHIH